MLSISAGKQPQTNHKIKSSTANFRREKSSSFEKESHSSVNNMGSNKVYFAPTAKYNSRSPTLANSAAEPITSQHKDNVAALSEEWEKVKADLNKQDDEKIQGVTQYIEKTPHPNLQNFRPFDLEDFWGRKQLSNIP